MACVPGDLMARLRAVRISPAQARWFVVVICLSVLGLKLWVATHTYGTNDVHTFMGFAQGVRDRGPVGVYSIDYRAMPSHWLYNHPPLVGYMLQLFNHLSNWGIPLRVSLRATSSAADALSGLLVYEILRIRGSLRKAALAGCAVAASPLLFLVSGYHGNTDPIFLMLVLLASYLLIDRSMGVLGGVALGLAVGIKIVAFGVLPVLAVYLVRHAQKAVLTAVAGFVVTTGVTWGPAVITHWSPLRHNVLGYAGIGSHAWGIVRFSDEAGWTGVTAFLVGPGTHLLVLICALLPAILAWHARSKAMQSVALCLVATLALLPGYGIQYLSWAVAAAYLLDFFTATIYSVLGGFVVFHVYSYWNHGVWANPANARPMTVNTLGLLALLWASLMAVLITGLRRAIYAPLSPSEVATGPEPAGAVVPRTAPAYRS